MFHARIPGKFYERIIETINVNADAFIPTFCPFVYQTRNGNCIFKIQEEGTVQEEDVIFSYLSPGISALNEHNQST